MGFVYLITCPDFERVKVGFWTSTLEKLINRYQTTLGKDLELYLYETPWFSFIEGIFMDHFKAYNIHCELFQKGHLEEYNEYLLECCKKDGPTLLHMKNKVANKQRDNIKPHIHHCFTQSIEKIETKGKHNENGLNLHQENDQSKCVSGINSLRIDYIVEDNVFVNNVIYSYNYRGFGFANIFERLMFNNEHPENQAIIFKKKDKIFKYLVCIKKEDNNQKWIYMTKTMLIDKIIDLICHVLLSMYTQCIMVKLGPTVIWNDPEEKKKCELYFAELLCFLKRKNTHIRYHTQVKEILEYRIDQLEKLSILTQPK